MSRDEIRLRILELALQHGLSTDKIGVADDFAGFVFDQEPQPLKRAVPALKIGKAMLGFSSTKKPRRR